MKDFWVGFVDGLTFRIIGDWYWAWRRWRAVRRLNRLFAASSEYSNTPWAMLDRHLPPFNDSVR